MGTPLELTHPLFQKKAPQLSVIIYWHPREPPLSLQNGHASLIIDSKAFQISKTHCYVSWSGTMPTTVATALNPRKTAVANTFTHDSASWGGQLSTSDKLTVLQGGPHNVPTTWYAVTGLDVAAMKAEWDTLRTAPANHTWSLLDKNCATVVHRILAAGGGDTIATKAKKQLVWWPSDLIKYAKSMGTSIVHRSHG